MRIRQRTCSWILAAAISLACRSDPPATTGDARGHDETRTDAAARQVHAPTIADVREWTRALSTDEMQGRRPGTPGGAKAVAYVRAEMETIGLSPGAGERWTQTVAMRSVATDRARSRLAVAPPRGRARQLVLGTDLVATTYRAAGTHRVDAPLVFVGYGITAPEYAWDDYDGLDVSDKVVVVLVGDPPVGPDRFAGDVLTYYGRWSYKFERALEAGALGCIVVHEDGPASYGWNVVENSWSRERFHAVDPDADLPDAMAIQGWISKATAEQLAKQSGSSLAGWHGEAIAAKFRARDLGSRLVGEFVTTERRVSDVNVVGRMPGAKWPDEAVVITAHWDHLGMKADARADEDAVFNGAIDNASGIAGMLAVATALQARAAAGRPLGRSVVFLATTGEEEGLLGSDYYASHPTVPLRHIAAVVNLDSMNVHGRSKTIQVIGPGQTTLEDILADIAAAEGRTVVGDEHPGSGGYYRSDHFSFARRGVPAIYVRGGSEMEDGGAQRGRELAETKAKHYHTVDDEFDESWSFAGALQDALTVAELVARVADAETPPQWRPSSEFASVVR
ncbi:MAG TPA: M28 family peptidase [Nannocystaceae bacterium]|nr:M28 family peptidase [Nannocystaceae bacterium]